MSPIKHLTGINQFPCILINLLCDKFITFVKIGIIDTYLKFIDFTIYYRYLLN